MKTKDTLKTVHKIAQEIKKCGGKAYFVGGCIRDKLLGKENKDIDIEVYGLTSSMLEVILTVLSVMSRIYSPLNSMKWWTGLKSVWSTQNRTPISLKTPTTNV